MRQMITYRAALLASVSRDAMARAFETHVLDAVRRVEAAKLASAPTAALASELVIGR